MAESAQSDWKPQTAAIPTTTATRLSVSPPSPARSPKKFHTRSSTSSYLNAATAVTEVNKDSWNSNGAPGLPVAGAKSEENKSGDINWNGGSTEFFNPSSRSQTILTELHIQELEKYCAGKKLDVPPSTSVCDPDKLYPQTLGFEPDVNVYNVFRLQQSNGFPSISEEQRKSALSLTQAFLTEAKETYLGYQANMKQEYKEDLFEYLSMHVNNVGDPFIEGNNRMHSKFMERAVLDYFASLWRAQWPHDNGVPGSQDKLPHGNSYWGYCLSMGATEGNLYGMWNGRDYLAGRVMLSDKIKKPEYVTATVEPSNIYKPDEATSKLRAERSFTPICFYSQDTHYSLKKCMAMLNIQTFYDEGSLHYPNSCPKLLKWTKETWPDKVPSNPDGSFDIESLAILVEFFVKRGYPILVNFNYGTTFTGAYDDVEAAGERLIPILEKYGMYERIINFNHSSSERTTTITRHGFWFHVDGALGAAYMPFIEAAHASQLLGERTGDLIMAKRGPNFDFRLPFVHSITMSGHKWIGAPVPCGIYMSKTKYQLLPPEIPMYVGTPDTTLSGSRSGLAAMFLWDFLARHSMPKLVQRAIKSEDNAKYLEERLKNIEQRLNADLYVFRASLSITVIFKCPSEEMVQKYSLSTETRSEPDKNNRAKKYAHAFAMDHVSTAMITRLCNDLLCNGYPDELESLKKSNPEAYEVIKGINAHPASQQEMASEEDDESVREINSNLSVSLCF